MMIPGTLTDLVGIAIVAAITVFQYLLRKRQQAKGEVVPAEAAVAAEELEAAEADSPEIAEVKSATEEAIAAAEKAIDEIAEEAENTVEA